MTGNGGGDGGQTQQLTCIRQFGGYCAWRVMVMHRVLCRLRCHRRTATCDRCEDDGCDRDGGGPNVLCELVPGRARAWMELCPKECSRSRCIAPPSCMLHRYVGVHSFDRR